MTITPVELAAVSANAFEPASLMQPAASTAAMGSPPVSTQSFAQMLSRVNEEIVSSQAQVQGLALGDAQNLHQVMVRLEEAKLGFQLMVQVRNRLLEAYQDIMKTQI